ncbi:MAG: hypothetical protein ABIJ56_20965 [Pseudomonadota bacterium]
MKKLISCAAAIFVCASCYGPDPDRERTDGGAVTTVYDYCRGNNNGVIERSEIVVTRAAQGLYRVNEPGSHVQVDVAGEAGGGGAALWDFTDKGERDFELRVDDLDGTWFEESFARATHTAPVDHLTGLLGVYRLGEDAMELLGAVSEEPGRVFLPYDEPVAVIRFPLKEGDSWSVDTGVTNGVADGLEVSSEETYGFEVIAAGDLQMGSFLFRGTLLLRVELEQRFPGGAKEQTWQFIWLHECYGELARISTHEQPEGDVVRAHELRRLETW